MSFKLRPYQQRCFDNTMKVFSTKVKDLPSLKMDRLVYHLDPDRMDDYARNLKIVAPPGAGKGSVIAYMAAYAYGSGSNILIWVHKTELCHEIYGRLVNQMRVPSSQIGFILAGHKVNKRCKIQIMSVMTGIRRDLSWFRADLKLTDESHRVLSNSQMKLHKQTVDAYMVSFTATPVRTDKKKFSDVYDAMLQLTTYRELMAMKFLVPTEVYVPTGAASLDGVKIRAGDYALGDLERRYMEERLYRALYSRWKNYTKGKLQTICFNVGKRHNKAVYEFFKMQGVSCAYVDESTPKALRKQIVDKFKEGPDADGAIMVLFNIALFCVDDQTEILTRDGWKGIDDMSYDDRVACPSLDGSIVFERPLNINKASIGSDSDMYSVSSGRMDIRVTGNHDMIFKYGDGKWRKGYANTLEGKGGVKFMVSGHASPERAKLPVAVPTEEKKYIRGRSYHLREKHGYEYEESKVQAKKDYQRYLETLEVTEPIDLTEDECRLIGFWLGDGSVNNLIRRGKEFIFCQSTTYPYICEWIEQVIKNCGLHFVKRQKQTNGVPYYVWSVGTGRGYGHQQRAGLHKIMHYLNKDGFDEMWSLHRSQFHAFLEGLWMADGDHGDGRGFESIRTFKIHNANKKLLDLIQSVAVCRGYMANIRKAGKPKESHNQVYKLILCRDKDFSQTATKSGFNLMPSKASENERVWCVTTSTGNIITRRNGVVTFTGNSEGVDAPLCKCVILNYATKSFAKYVQSTARGSRPVWNEDNTDWLRLPNGEYYKDKLTVIDMGGNTNRFCMLEDYDVVGFDLDGNKPKGIPPTKTCPECRKTCYASLKACPSCGHEFEIKSKEDKKKVADEVEFEKLSNTHRAYRHIKSFNLDQIKKVFPPGWLRSAALVHGKRQPDGRVLIEGKPVMMWVFEIVNDRYPVPKSRSDMSKISNRMAFEKYIEAEEAKQDMAQTYMTLLHKPLL